MWGGGEDKAEYWAALAAADVVVSTAHQETFGVAMSFLPSSFLSQSIGCPIGRLEATHLGCLPLCPNRLVYPELFPPACLFNTRSQLVKRLRGTTAKLPPPPPLNQHLPAELCRAPDQCGQLWHSQALSSLAKPFDWDGDLKEQYLSLLKSD